MRQTAPVLSEGHPNVQGMKQTTWQYKVTKLGQHWSEEYVEGKLNQAGAEGYEAVGMGRLPVTNWVGVR